MRIWALIVVVAVMTVVVSVLMVLDRPSIFSSAAASRRRTETATPAPRRHILVVVLSETRAYKHTFDRFRQNVLDHLGADLALCVADRTVDLGNPFYVRANYTWLFPDLTDWGVAFELAYRTKYWRTGSKWREFFLVGDQFSDHARSAGILIFMRWWLYQRLMEMKVEYEWYIVTRSDYYYLHPHPNVFNDTDIIWVPEGEDYGGITDRHAVLPRQFVNMWLDFLETLMEDPTATVATMRKVRPPGGWNLEALLKWRLETTGAYPRVKRFKQGMFTVRDAETRTRWSTGEWDPSLKLFIKYPEEYKRARAFPAYSILAGKSEQSQVHCVNCHMQIGQFAPVSANFHELSSIRFAFPVAETIWRAHPRPTLSAVGSRYSKSQSTGRE